MELALLALYGLVILRAALPSGLSEYARNPRGRDRHRAGPDAEAFYVNNRSGGPWAVGFSIIVSCVGASATVGMIGLAFAAGTPAFWWLGAGAAGLTALSLFLAGKVRASGAYTLPQMAETFLGPGARQAIALVIVTAWTAILAAQFSALTALLAPLTALPAPACLGLGLLLVCGHTMGGQRAIMRADRVQAAIIVSALAALLAWLSVHNPGWLAAVRPEAVNDGFPPAKLVYFLVVVGANYVICPMLFGRMFSARDEKSARLGGLIGAAGIALCAVLIVAVGLACVGVVPPGTPQDGVLAALLDPGAGNLPRWMRLAVSLALVSAIVSSADSCLVTAATVLSFDVVGHGRAGRQDRRRDKRRASWQNSCRDRRPHSCQIKREDRGQGLLVPGASGPETFVPDSLVPDGLGPDGPRPDGLGPAGLNPAGLNPDSPRPDGLRPDCHGPDASGPHGAATPSARSGRACVILLGLAGAALSLSGKGILGFLLAAYDVFACGVAAPLFIGLVSRSQGGLDPRCARAAVIVGGLLGGISAMTGEAGFSYAGMAASGFLAWLGALPGRRPQATGPEPAAAAMAPVPIASCARPGQGRGSLSAPAPVREPRR